MKQNRNGNTGKDENTKRPPRNQSPLENEPPVESSPETGTLEAAIAEADDLLQRLVRWQADFENLRKRGAREILDARRLAEGDFARDMLDVLDHFESALSADPSKTDAATLLQGVKITYDELRKVLAQRGIESYDPTGAPFDPHWHEAIARETTSACPPLTVLQTLQRGYKISERVLRPAKVKVSVAPDNQ